MPPLPPRELRELMEGQTLLRPSVSRTRRVAHREVALPGHLDESHGHYSRPANLSQRPVARR